MQSGRERERGCRVNVLVLQEVIGQVEPVWDNVMVRNKFRTSIAHYTLKINRTHNKNLGIIMVYLIITFPQANLDLKLLSNLSHFMRQNTNNIHKFNTPEDITKIVI